MIRQSIIVVILGMTVSSCGGGVPTSSTSDIDAGSTEVSIAAALPASVIPAPVVMKNPYAESITANSGQLVVVPESSTAEITTQADFLFDTSRSVSLHVDLPSAYGRKASLSLCMDFQESDVTYIVNYDSCALRATLANGQFVKNVELMNQFDSAIGVIWFTDQESSPLYRKFTTADFIAVEGGYEWRWN